MAKLNHGDPLRTWLQQPVAHVGSGARAAGEAPPPDPGHPVVQHVPTSWEPENIASAFGRAPLGDKMKKARLVGS